MQNAAQTSPDAPALASPPAADAAVPRGGLPAAARPRLVAVDREFLPAALEIIETPASPVRIAFIVFICAAFSAVIAWSYFGLIDIHAVAQGRIQPSGRSKVVQPLEPGRVVRILVENGSRVNVGDALVELDPTETGADREALARDVAALEAEIARRRVAIEAAQTQKPEPADIRFPPSTVEVLRSRETGLLKAEIRSLVSSLESLRAQLAERQAQQDRLSGSVKAREKLVAVLHERVDMREKLNAKQYGSRAAVIDALQERDKEAALLATERGQVLEAAAAIRSLQSKLVETVSSFVTEQTQKLAEAERKLDRTLQDLVKARTKNERTLLRAPIAGTVQQLTLTTVGQVVTSGQSVLTIVPFEGNLEIEALVLNQDIGFVEPGQPVVVKVESFPFTRYGTLDGTVVKVSRDAVDEKEATGLSDPNAATRPQPSVSPSAARTQNLVFPATVALKSQTIDIEGKQIPLSAGMMVAVEIKTGTRRAIDYVLSPLREVVSTAGRQR